MKGSILRTLSYSDIFDYPLTAKQIYRYLISTKKTSVKLVNSALLVLQKNHSISHKGNYYFLPGRNKLASLRRLKSKYSRPKKAEAKRVGEWLKIFPSIKMVAITGAISMNNSTKNDDIDLMIVTSPNSLWLTRFFVIPLISLIANRRLPDTNQPSKPKSYNNSICLNLWLDQDSLAIPVTSHNLYTAHEVAQIKPLWDRDNTYQAFLGQNRWLNKYLPNIKIVNNKPKNPHHPLIAICSKLNLLAFKLQFKYMQSKITNEKISPKFAFFHPRQLSRPVSKKYHHRLKKLKVKP